MEEFLKKALNNVGEQLKIVSIDLALARAQIQTLTEENEKLKQELSEVKQNS